uniref:Secreted salivary protein n=1 Tax=Culicoides nubeculosus TaxID=144565 RepID=B9URL1_CULNU|nr:secreted salivary protein [Culicoides nubeculosus]
MRTFIALFVQILLIESIFCSKIRFLASLNANQALFDRLAKRPTVLSNIPGNDCTLTNELAVLNDDNFNKLDQTPVLTEVEFKHQENICNKMLETLKKNNKALLVLNSDLFNRLIYRLGINSHNQVKNNVFGVGLYSCPSRATSQLIAFYSDGQQIPTDWCLQTNYGQECSSINKKDIQTMRCDPA